MTTLDRGTIAANRIEFAYLAAGPASGPLALCMHGFPDTAHTYRHLLPRLADAGYRAVAPFLRGYAPSGTAPDGAYSSAALVADCNALHEVLGGDERAIVVGHDWGATAGYGTAVMHPDRWRRVVAMALPVGPALASIFLTYEQVKRSFYIYFFQGQMADVVVPANDMEFVAKLWADWSPGYDAAEDMAHVRQSLAGPENVAAALGKYRATFSREGAATYPDERRASGKVPPQPTLYLHGADDGCIGAAAAEAARPLLSPGSDVRVIDGAGHFLHLEKPGEVNDAIVAFVAG